MSEIKDLTEKLIAFRNERDWKKFHNPKDVALSLVLEAAEVLEHFQWKNLKEVKKHAETHKDAIGEELADTFNWILMLSHDLGIDIIKTSEKKLEQNKKKYPISKAKGNAKKYTEL